MDWNSRAEHETRKLLHDYIDENSYLIFAPDSPTTNPYNLSVIPDDLDIVTTKNISFPIYLASFSAYSSDTSEFSFTLRVAHPFTTHRIALASVRSGIVRLGGNRHVR